MVVSSGFLLFRGPDTVRCPDASFIDARSLSPGDINEAGPVPKPPTLAVEVPTWTALDSTISDRIDDYLAAGVPRIWVVRPKRQTVTVYRDDRTARIVGLDGVLESDDAGFSVGGFRLPVAELFG